MGGGGWRGIRGCAGRWRRWGQAYDVRLVSFAAMKEAAHLALNPFGQIPTFEDGALRLFETGAIVLHIAACYAGLLPGDAAARARAVMWMFAAVNTVEPPILEIVTVKFVEGDRAWAAERMGLVLDRVRVRLRQLSAWLGEAEWLDGAFSAGDLMMVSVLLRLRASGCWGSLAIWRITWRGGRRGGRISGRLRRSWRLMARDAVLADCLAACSGALSDRGRNVGV